MPSSCMLQLVSPISTTRLGLALRVALEVYVGVGWCVGPLPWALGLLQEGGVVRLGLVPLDLGL